MHEPNLAPRVLVAEDDPELRALLADALTRDGFDVVGVGGTAEARLELLIAGQSEAERLPAVVVTDQRMSDGLGLDLVAEIRRRWWWMPAVVVTAFPDAELRQRAATLGACRVLAKPVDLHLVRLAVREAAIPA